MCDVNLLNTSGNADSFSADYEDCNQVIGNAQIDEIFATNSNVLYSVNGVNTSGASFSDEILVPITEAINPTKVFNYIAKKIKEVLCPTCS